VHVKLHGLLRVTLGKRHSLCHSNSCKLCTFFVVSSKRWNVRIVVLYTFMQSNLKIPSLIFSYQLLSTKNRNSFPKSPKMKILFSESKSWHERSQLTVLEYSDNFWLQELLVINCSKCKYERGTIVRRQYFCHPTVQSPEDPSASLDCEQCFSIRISLFFVVNIFHDILMQSPSFTPNLTF
jgi:hypothetical protein